MGTQGLVIVNTGNGKGKTSAALGVAMRSWGNGLSVLILQFIKGSWKYGELNAIEALNKIDEKIKIIQGGMGFTKRGNTPLEKHIIEAEKLLDIALIEMENNYWDIIILDEINYAISFGLLKEDCIFKLLDNKPQNTHLIFTGRNAPDCLVEKADIVTEMKQIKHAFEKGIQAQKGIEF